MKKLSILSIVLAMLVALVGCTSATSSAAPSESTPVSSVEQGPESSEQVAEGSTLDRPINLAALKGPTAMGLAKLITDNEATNIYATTLAGSADEITPKIISGDLDIAAVPANLASVLYNNTQGEVVVLAINTLGVLYILENGETIQSVEDLKGKTIYSAGKGSTPEYALSYMLTANGIDPEKDVTIEYKTEHTEALSMFLADENSVVMLPQPFATTAMMKNDTVRIAIDLNTAWENSTEGPATLITGVVVANKNFALENPQAVSSFLEEYKASVDFVNNNIEDAAVLIGDLGIVTAEVAEKAIPYCAITFIAGEEMQTKLASYLEILFLQNPKGVGGTLPDENFYYTEK